MKKTFLALCFGVVALAAAVGALIGGDTYAATNTYLKLDGGENIYIASGSKSNIAGTATYNASTKTLTLNQYKSDGISTDIDSLKINLIGESSIAGNAAAITSTGNVSISGTGSLTINKNTSIAGTFSIGSLCTVPKSSIMKIAGKNVFSTDGKNAANASIKIAADCTAKENPANPDTFDPIFIYIGVLAVSSVAFLVVLRRRFVR